MKLFLSKREKCAEIIKSMARQMNMPSDIIQALEPLAIALQSATNKEIAQMHNALLALKKDFAKAKQQSLGGKSLTQSILELNN